MGGPSKTQDRSLPRYEDETQVPRDLRTAEELAANQYTRLGEPRAELTVRGATKLLYSTSEARKLKHDLWPRGRKLTATGAPVDVTAGPYGAPQRASNPGASSSAPPGSAAYRARAPMLGAGAPPELSLGDRHAWPLTLFEDGFVVLDTETTGLGARAAGVGG